jgi:3-isopropylmalate/(R)-2-methylmalate dehydratase large subunit
MGRTLFTKVWDEHVVAELGGGAQLLAVDRHLLHDLGGGQGLAELGTRGLRVASPDLTFATPDHVVSTVPGRRGGAHDWANRLIDSLRSGARAAGVRLFDVGEDGQGIVHVIGPELGLTQPGTLVVCGDSHTCTNGALGAVGFGIGASEIVHVLATQTVVQRRPKTMRAAFDGALPRGVHAKDLVLALIGRLGTAGATGYALEYAGSAIRALDMEGRMTLCNLSIELGAKVGMVAPDDTTFEWLRGRRFAPAGERWDAALAYWKSLPSDPDAKYDAEAAIEVDALAPQLTWGTSPEDVIGVGERIPDPARESDPTRRRAKEEALAYMGLRAGTALAGVRVDRVFIGSCTNSRLPDLRAAAALVRGRKVAAHVRAWVVPGSVGVKRAAESEGLHEVFLDAGFEWREPGCSLCVGANGELVEPGARCVSTSNRNFVGRQGPGARTHLASPASAAACALAGEICDPRAFLA